MAFDRSFQEAVLGRLLPDTPYTSYLADCRLRGISTCPIYLSVEISTGGCCGVIGPGPSTTLDKKLRYLIVG